MFLPIIEKREGAGGERETWVQFCDNEEPWLVRDHHWVGFDFDGVLSLPDSSKPYRMEDLGVPVPEMVEAAKRLIDAGITVKVFTARACDREMVPKIQAWTKQNHLGKLEVTNTKDYEMVRFYDDRAIQVIVDFKNK